jgi:hypothetical protein
MSLTAIEARRIISMLRIRRANGSAFIDLAAELGWISRNGQVAPARIKLLQRWTNPPNRTQRGARSGSTNSGSTKLAWFSPTTLKALEGGRHFLAAQEVCLNCRPYAELGDRLGSNAADLQRYVGQYFRYRRTLNGEIKTHARPVRIEPCPLCDHIRAVMPTGAQGVGERIGGVWLTQGCLQLFFVEQRYTGLVLVRATEPSTHSLTGIMSMLEWEPTVLPFASRIALVSKALAASVDRAALMSALDKLLVNEGRANGTLSGWRTELAHQATPGEPPARSRKRRAGRSPR